MGRFVEKASASEAGVMSDHPILKRKRVQRDLSQVILGQRNDNEDLYWFRK